MQAFYFTNFKFINKNNNLLFLLLLYTFIKNFYINFHFYHPLTQSLEDPKQGGRTGRMKGTLKFISSGKSIF
jgi:hypothetical protein